jgi:autotransporter-associated beta strand protein
MGANAFKGWSGGTMDVTLNGGTLTLNDGITEGGNHNLGFVTLNGGTISGVGNATFGGFNLSSSVDVTENSTISATNTNTNGGTRTITVSAGKTLTWSGTISNGYLGAPSSFIFDGTGTTVLSGLNSYTGNTVINDGTFAVTAAGSLRFSPTTNGVNNSVSGSSTATLSFLGTVSLDLTAANTTVGNSWSLFNLGSFTGPVPTLNPAAVTSTTLGSFTQVSPGVWELPVTGAKWVFTKSNGTLTYATAATDYDTWGAPYGLAAGSEGGDLDGDGVKNQAEYAFGLIPNSGSSVNPITVQLNKTTGTFTYQRRTQSLTGLTYSVWTSTDLVGWTPSTVTENITGPVANVETVQITLNPIPTAPKLFVQVRAN